MRSKLLANSNAAINYVKSKKIKIYGTGTIDQLLGELKERDLAGHRATITDLTNLLVDKLGLQTENFFSPKGKIRFTLYHKGKLNELEIINSILNKGAYFSHGTIADIILENTTENYYITDEQLENTARVRSPLSQNDIDEAFSRPTKYPENFLLWRNSKIIFTRRKLAVAWLGVHIIRNTTCLVTNLERTMLDIVVRPEYAGGAQNVLKAFQILKEELDTASLFDYLEKFAFLYPYHQAIGFYMEAAGYPIEKYAKFQMRPIQLNFYLQRGLTHSLGFNEKWKIYFPEEMFTS